MLYIMSTTQVPGTDAYIPNMTVPVYYDTALKNKNWVAFYASGASSVLVSTDDNDALNMASDVVRIDPTTLDSVADQGTLDTINSLSGAAIATSGSTSTSTSTSKGVLDGGGGVVTPPPPAQTYRDALQALNSGSPIVMSTGDGLTV